MGKEIILKKLEQIKVLLVELEKLLARPLSASQADLIALRAAERDFQLIVELASDINTTLLIEKTGKTPDSYRSAFSDMAKLNIFGEDLLAKLVTGAKLRNILVHEYDLEEDVPKFYHSAKAMVPVFREYLSVIFNFIEET